MDNPIFISGLRKSGTTLTKCLLDSHPELYVYPPRELHLFRYTPHKSIIKDKKARHTDPNQILNDLANLKFVNRLNKPNSSAYREGINISKFKKEITNFNPDSYSDVYEALYYSMFSASNYVIDSEDNYRFVSKSVVETEFFPYLLQWYPDMKFVYVLRNPYAHFAARRTSMRVSGMEDSQISDVKHRYPFIGAQIRRMSNSYYYMEKMNDLHPEQFHILNFDNLLRNPEKELRSLCGFLNIDYHESLEMPTICGVPWGGNSFTVDEKFEGIDKRPLSHWKDNISDGEIKIINEFFSDVVEQYRFDVQKSEKSIFYPFHSSEYDPRVYLANRFIYLTNSIGEQSLFGTYRDV